MKKTAISLLAILLCFCVCTVAVSGAEYLVPVGRVIGLSLSDGSVTIVSFDEAMGQHAKSAGLCAGDKILAVDDTPITCAEDIRQALCRSNGTVTLKLERKGKEQILKLSPQITEDGPKLGIFLKEGVTGIGTVTFYNPENGNFGALGHGVSDAQGKILELVSGNAYSAHVSSVKKGKAGQPGQLRGALSHKEAIGTLVRNTNRGLFGNTSVPWSGKALEVASCDQIKTGAASILSTINGDCVQEYSVEICKIYPLTRSGDKNMLIRITDPRLLETTGGIVQGMSGSPIIQDGKLVGAVTHVLVNDPTTGYGIFIENMLEAAG